MSADKSKGEVYGLLRGSRYILEPFRAKFAIDDSLKGINFFGVTRHALCVVKGLEFDARSNGRSESEQNHARGPLFKGNKATDSVGNRYISYIWYVQYTT